MKTWLQKRELNSHTEVMSLVSYHYFILRYWKDTPTNRVPFIRKVKTVKNLAKARLPTKSQKGLKRKIRLGVSTHHFLHKKLGVQRLSPYEHHHYITLFRSCQYPNQTFLKIFLFTVRRGNARSPLYYILQCGAYPHRATTRAHPRHIIIILYIL